MTTLPTSTATPPPTAAASGIAAAPRAGVRRGAPSAATLVGIEIRKTLSTRSGVGLAATAAVLPAVATLGASADGAQLGSALVPIGSTGVLVALLLLALGVLSSAGEWTHRTVQTTFLVVPQRTRVLAAKAAAAAVLGVAVAAVAASASAAVLWLAAGDTIGWDGAGRAVAAVVAGGAALAVAGVGIGAAVGNVPAALTGVYLAVLGVIPLLGTVRPEIAEAVDPTDAVLTLAAGDDAGRAALVLAGWMVVGTVAGILVTRRRAVA
jgi:hypothetical protein